MDSFSHTFKSMLRRRRAAAQSESRPLRELTADLDELLDTIRHNCGDSGDIIIRRFSLTGPGEPHDAALVFLDGMANSNEIIDSLMFEGKETGILSHMSEEDQPMDLIRNYVLRAQDVRDIVDYDDLYKTVLSGDTVILLNGHAGGLAASTREWAERGISEPATQSVIRGPRDSFTETLRTNTGLIRRRIKEENLWLEMKQIGRVTKTDVAMMYMNGIANPKVVSEVRRRLDRIDIDAVLESSYIEELIQDAAFTPFPTVYNTERPDVAAAGLLEGRVVIIVDGTPFVLLAPTLFTHFMQTAEDYYQRWDFSSLIRILRYICLFIALLAPSVYIAVTTFHQEMIPTPLLINLTSQREGVPFPAFLEALLMELILEILREAGIRMPRAIGQSISIVGALVIGQSAVDAGLAGPAMVIVVSITALANFAIPAYNMGITIRMIRFLLMMLAASFGLFGILVGLIAMVLHLCSLRSFGIPYMAPFGPIIMEDQKDNVIRVPIWAMFTRPRLVNQLNMQRERKDPPMKPEPPGD